MLQLWHVGMGCTVVDPPVPETARFGLSGIALDGKNSGREITQADMDNVLASYATAAATTEALRFSSVGLHGSHGYLTDQFMRAHATGAQTPTWRYQGPYPFRHPNRGRLPGHRLHRLPDLFPIW
ncbi:oxidoreductase [Nocardia sp. X0981]